jgi:hypothetical protein
VELAMAGEFHEGYPVSPPGSGWLAVRDGDRLATVEIEKLSPGCTAAPACIKLFLPRAHRWFTTRTP